MSHIIASPSVSWANDLPRREKRTSRLRGLSLLIIRTLSAVASDHRSGRTVRARQRRAAAGAAWHPERRVPAIPDCFTRTGGILCPVFTIDFTNDWLQNNKPRKPPVKGLARRRFSQAERAG